MKKKKPYKKLTAEQAIKMTKSEKAWNDLLGDIKYQAEAVRAVRFDTTYIPERFITRLMILGFNITKGNYGTYSISWETSPSIKEYDAMIKELQDKRDELKKERLTKKLAGI